MSQLVILLLKRCSNNVMKDRIIKYWPVFTAIVLVIYNVGYTISSMDDRPTKEEVTLQISVASEELKSELKDKYVEISKVPGLKEQIESINEKLNMLGNRFSKIEDKILYGK